MANRFEQRAMERASMADVSQPMPMQQDQSFEEEAPLNRFEQRALERQQQPEQEPDSWGKSIARTLLQIPSGVAKAVTYPLDLINAVGYAEATSPDAIDDLRRASQQFGIPFDEQEYLDAAGRHTQRFPTVSNAEREVEEWSGGALPLQARNKLQKFVNFASSAGKIAPKNYTFRGMNTSLNRPVLGTGVAATAEIAKDLGANETLADIASFAILKKPTQGSGRFIVGKATKPSGLPTRRYENVLSERKVPPETIAKIESKVEKDFKKITDEIIESSPIGPTHKAINESYEFKHAAQDSFRKVEDLAESIPGKISTDEIKRKIIDNVLNKKSTGYTPSEYEKSFKNEIYKVIQETKTKDVTAQSLVGQYRKNNKQLGEIFEPGKSFSQNKAKRDALIEHNRAISDIIEQQYPNSEFSKLFKESNKKWSEIMDAEYIDKFLDELFTGGINYEKGKEFFNKHGMTRVFEKSMGEEGFSKFKTLMNDLLSTEKAHKLLKAAKSKGYQDFEGTLGSYIMHPNLAKAKIGVKAIGGGFKKIYHMLLDKPKLTLQWDKAIHAAKAGDFKTAEALLNEVREAEILFDNKPKPKASEKPIVTINAKAERVEPAQPTIQSTKQIETKSQEVKEPTPPLKKEIKQIEGEKKAKALPHKPIVHSEVVSEGPLKGTKIEIEGKTFPKILVNGKRFDTRKLGSYEGLAQLQDLPHKLKYSAKEAEVAKEKIAKYVKQVLEKEKINDQKALIEPKRKEVIAKVVEELGETRGKGQQYHGTGQNVEALSKDHYSDNNIYGQGFYTTDAIDVAQGYSKGKLSDANAKAPVLYKVDERIKPKLLDLDAPIRSQKELLNEIKKISSDEVQYALEQNPKTFRDIYDSVRGEPLSKDAIQDIFYELQTVFEKLGYDGLIHKGGNKTNTTPHEVRIYFKPDEVLDLVPLKRAKQVPARKESGEVIHLDDKSKKKSSMDEPVPNTLKEYAEQKERQRIEKSNMTWEELEKVYKKQNPQITQKALDLLKIYHEGKVKSSRDFTLNQEKEKLAQLNKSQGKGATKEKSEVIKKINELELEKHNLNKKQAEKVDTKNELKDKIEAAANKPEISAKGLKYQKDYILDEVDRALSLVREDTGEYWDKGIKIDVPGDGTFKLKTRELPLEEFKKRVEKSWPEAPKSEKYLTNPKPKQPTKLQNKAYYESKVKILNKERDILKRRIESSKKNRTGFAKEEKELQDLMDLFQSYKILWEKAPK